MHRLTILILISEAKCMDPITKDLVIPSKQSGEACGYESCPTQKEGMINVHIVPHTHGELGYSATFQQHYTGTDDFYTTTNINMKRILDYTISELWAHEERKFTFSDMPYFFHWWSNRDGTVRRMVYQLLRQGRLYFVGGGWGLVDEATTNYHAIIDQFTYSLRKLNATFLDCGLPLVSWQADSFGHSKEVASLLALMGFDGHFINPISFDDELARMRRKGMEFLWRGSDDLGPETDIYTHKLFDGYWSPPGFCFGSSCNDPLLVTSDTMFKNIDDRVDFFIKSMQHRQSPYYTTDNVMVMMGQRMGYYDASVWFANIDKLINEVNRKSYSSGAKLHLYYSTPACYLKAVHHENPQLEIKQDDFLPLAYDKFSHATGMYTSRPTLKYVAREGHLYLQLAKQLQVFARLWSNNKIFEDLNWIVGVFQDHNVISGALRDYVKDYYMEKMERAVQKSTLLFKQAFNKLRKSSLYTLYHRCAFNISSCNNTESTQYFLVIYNPLAWNVTVPVRLPIQKAEYDVWGPNLEIINTSIISIPQAILDIPERRAKAKHELVFLAEDLPPLGFRSYFLRKAETREKRSIIKKIKNPNKKYLIRQTSTVDNSDRSLLNVKDDYYYTEDVTEKSEAKIEFANITKIGGKDFGIILTPKPRAETAKIYSTTSKDDVFYQYDEYTTKKIEVTTETEPVTEDVKTIPILRVSEATEESKDMFISNKYIRIDLDSSRKITKMSLSNSVTIPLDIQFYFYTSDQPLEMGRVDKKKPGAYIFRPIENKPEAILDFLDTKVFKSGVVEEIHCRYSSYASFAMKLYTERAYVVLDWLVGPIPSTDDVGKEVFIRYTTDLENEGVFYTDANGRQTIKRIRNIQATYEPVNMDAIPGNFYPVTSKIHIEDVKKNIRFSIFNDRTQGGSSLHDGEIDLMIHRRVFTDDTGTQTWLNETEFGHGIIVRGQHVLYLSKADYKQNKIYEKILAKELAYPPLLLVSRDSPYGYYSKTKWSKEVNEFTALKKKLPLGIHLLTVEEWNSGTILLRLENYLEKSDTVKSGIKTVFLKDLFVNLKINSLMETTLSAHLWLKDWAPLIWNKKEKFVKSFNKFYGDFNGTAEYCDDEELKKFDEVNFEKGIVLAPQQIRTFVVWFDYVNIKIGNVL